MTVQAKFESQGHGSKVTVTGGKMVGNFMRNYSKFIVTFCMESFDE